MSDAPNDDHQATSADVDTPETVETDAPAENAAANQADALPAEPDNADTEDTGVLYFRTWRWFGIPGRHGRQGVVKRRPRPQPTGYGQGGSRTGPSF